MENKKETRTEPSKQKAGGCPRFLVSIIFGNTRSKRVPSLTCKSFGIKCVKK